VVFRRIRSILSFLEEGTKLIGLICFVMMNGPPL